jgi:hypothetical protein
MKSSYHIETRNHKNRKFGSVRFIFGMVFRFGFKMHRVSHFGARPSWGPAGVHRGIGQGVPPRPGAALGSALHRRPRGARHPRRVRSGDVARRPATLPMQSTRRNVVHERRPGSTAEPVCAAACLTRDRRHRGRHHGAVRRLGADAAARGLRRSRGGRGARWRHSKH